MHYTCIVYEIQKGDFRNMSNKTTKTKLKKILEIYFFKYSPVLGENVFSKSRLVHNNSENK